MVTDGRYRRSITNAGVDVPKSLAVNPRRPLITEQIRHPASLTIDYAQDHKIYWVYSKLNTIESMRPDGSSRRAIVKGDQLRHPVSFDVFRSNMYCVKRDTGELLRKDKFGRGVQVIRKKPFGKLARLTSLSLPQSVTFRHGTNVEFITPGFPGGAAGGSGNEVPPMEGYNLQEVNTGKTRDFSNPMYDAVQSGNNTDSSLSNGSGIYELPHGRSKSKPICPFTEPVSAILAPSSISHISSPQLQLRTREMDPSADTTKDTQYKARSFTADKRKDACGSFKLSTPRRRSPRREQ